jgi:hypothetical protein
MAASKFTVRVGALVGQGLSTYLRNFLPFTVLAGIVLSPWIAFRLFVQQAPHADEASVLPMLGPMIENLLTFVLTGAVTYGVVMQLRGEPASFAQVLAKGLQSFLRVFGTGFLCGLRIMLFTLLLVIPGIIQQVRLYVAIPVSVMEAKGGGDAMARSVELTRGSGWPIFGSWLVVWLVSMGLGLGVAQLIVTRTIPVSVAPWLEIGIAVFCGSFGATMMAVCYFMLRHGKENVDVKQLAAVFD